MLLRARRDGRRDTIARTSHLPKEIPPVVIARRCPRPLRAAGLCAVAGGMVASLLGTAASVAVAATSGPNGAPSAQTLATVRAQAAAVQANLVAGATRLDAARATLATLQARADAATAAAARVADVLAGLRGQLAGYAADLYVHPTDQAAASALTGDRDLAVSVQGVAMLAIVNRGRADVLRTVVVDEQEAQQLQVTADQLVAAADAAQASVATQVATLQAASDHAVATLNQALSAYQAEEQREAAQAIAAARASRNAAARAVANKQAAALAASLAADAAGETGSVADCAAPAGGYPAGPWGGYANGLIPSSSLCPITGGGRLRPDAAAAFNQMSRAYAQAFGSPHLRQRFVSHLQLAGLGVPPAAVVGRGARHEQSRLGLGRRPRLRRRRARGRRSTDGWLPTLAGSAGCIRRGRSMTRSSRGTGSSVTSAAAAVPDHAPRSYAAREEPCEGATMPAWRVGSRVARSRSAMNFAAVAPSRARWSTDNVIAIVWPTTT